MRSWLVVACIAATLLPASAARAASKRPKVVVLNIKPVDDSTQKIASTLTEILTTDLAKTGRFEVMAESEIGALLSLEKQRQLLGCSDAGCLAEIGGALGCDFLLLGTLGKFGQQLRIDLKWADARRSRIVGRDGELVGSVDELVPAGRRLLKSVTTEERGERAPVAQVTESPERDPGAGPYVLIGVGGAAVAAGGALVGVTLGRKSSYTFAQADRQVSAGIITGGVGLAALAAGVIWKVAAPESPVAVGLAPTSRGAALCAAGRF